MFLLFPNVDDPNFRNSRPNHREYMKTKVKMISVVQFKSIDFINLCIYTQRIEYIRECVLLPYLNDYSFTLTSIVSQISKLRSSEAIINELLPKFLTPKRNKSSTIFSITLGDKILMPINS